jgi:hypothetical protein
VSSTLALLADLRSRGIELVVAGDRIRYRPKAALTPELARRVLALKPALLDALQHETVAEDGERVAELVLSPELFKVRTIDDLIDLWADDSSPPIRCFTCRGVRWWRLRAGGPWVCPRCHPPLPALGEIEWRDGGGAA